MVRTDLFSLEIQEYAKYSKHLLHNLIHFFDIMSTKFHRILRKLKNQIRQFMIKLLKKKKLKLNTQVN